ncbi:MAG: SH3 domain-containing protein, partial [Bacillota bacterium]
MKRLAAAATFFLLVGAIAPAEAATLRPIDKDGLNLRAGPGTTYAVVGGLAPDQEATILGKEGDWYRIRLASGTEGWVAGWFSRVLLEDEQRYAMVNTDVLNVRREPSLTAPILTRLVQDQYVRLLEMIPEWWRVRLDDGTEGWVAAQYMKRATTPPPATPPSTPPATPPTTPPVAPPATPGLVPPAPAGTVPVLAIEPPRALSVLPGKAVQVKAETGVYAGPNSEARRVDTVRPGETLHLLDAASGWVRTETPRGKRGWIHGSLVQVTDGRLKLALGERAWALEVLTASPAVTPPADDTAFRAVRDTDGLNLRLIPAVAAKVLATLPQGAVLEVLQKDGVWLRVKTADGLTGWVHGGYTIPAGEPAQPQTPTPPPSTTPVAAGDTFKVSMEQPFDGASRLVVQTAGKPVGQPVQQGSTLIIPFETGETAERAIPLNTLGVKQATVTPAGLKLDLVGQPNHKVEESATGKLSVLLRPVLKSITTETVDGKAVFRFNLSGYAQPAAREAGENIIVEIPGAVLDAPIAQNGFRVVQHETGVRIAIPTYRAFSMKRSDQGFYLVVYPAGLKGKAILLDPGHGGDDSGAVSRLLGVVEKEINLQVSLRVRALLEARGAKVFMTRVTDRRAAPEEFL